MLEQMHSQWERQQFYQYIQVIIISKQDAQVATCLANAVLCRIQHGRVSPSFNRIKQEFELL